MRERTPNDIVKGLEELRDDIRKFKYLIGALIFALFVAIASSSFIAHYRLSTVETRLNTIDSRSASNKTNIRVHNAAHERGEEIESNRTRSGKPDTPD